jgi:type VI secretion system secreted protein Hcp
MDSLLMKVQGFKGLIGASSMSKVVDQKGDSFPLISAEWAISRNVSMDLGNANNSDSGEIVGGTITVTRYVDGLSPALNTIFFKPQKGRQIDFIYGTPETDGSGFVRQRVLVITDAKVVDYKVSTEGDDESGFVPVETIVFSFADLVTQFFPTLASGALGEITNDMVEYDFTQSKLVAGSKI